MTKQEYIAKYWEQCKAAVAGTAIFALLALAESGEESGWGESGLAKNHNNFFGLKSTESWEESGGQYVVLPTKENVGGKVVTIDAKFRTYKTFGDCIKNWVHFVTQPGYVAHGVLKAVTPEAQIRCIAATGYATAPNYAAECIGRMNELRALLPESEATAIPYEA